MDYDDFGNRMKAYENQYNNIWFDGSCPVVCRLDGRAFHSITKKLERPFDKKFRDCMASVTCNLVKDFNAVIGYTQSDEITLVLYAPREESQLPFGGKLFKLTSVLASACSNYFNNYRDIDGDSPLMDAYLSSKRNAQFDCRVFQVPTESEAINNLLWRQRDCYRNAVLSVAQYKYGHKRIHGFKVAELVEMMSKDGVDIEKDYGISNIYGIHIFNLTRQTVKFIGQDHQSLIDFVFEKFHLSAQPDAE